MNDPMHALANAITEKFILAAPKEAAKALETLATHEILLLVSSLKAQVLVSCFNVMTPGKAAAVIRRLPLKQASYILMHLDVPQAALLMQEFSAPYQERIKAALPESFVQILRQIPSFPAGSAGHLMQTDFISIKTDFKIAQLVERLKNLPRTKLPSVCFVTGKDGALKGFIRTPELAFYEPDSICGSVMTPCAGIAPNLSGTELETALAQASVDSLPVVNDKQILVGIISRFAKIPCEKEETFWKKWTHH